MNGNQITISVNSDDFNQLRNIARTRGQTVSDYISYLVSANLLKSSAASAAMSTPAKTGADMKRAEPTVLTTVRARAR
jgi:hypothetical protein